MSHNFPEYWPRGYDCRDSISHNFLFSGVKIGSNTAFHCFVLQRKLIYSIKYVVYEIKRQNLFIIYKLKKKKKIAIAHCNSTGKTIFLLPQRGSKDCIQTT